MIFGSRFAGALAVALTIFTASAVSAQQITTIGNGRAYGLTTDVNGNVYFPDYNANTLVVIPSNGDGTYVRLGVHGAVLKRGQRTPRTMERAVARERWR